jgi:hypothetical protein
VLRRAFGDGKSQPPTQSALETERFFSSLITLGKEIMTESKKSPFASASLFAPAIAIVGVFIFVLGKSSGTGGDMVGWAFFLYAGCALGFSSVVGIICALISFLRRESASNPRFCGMLLNFMCLIPGLYCAKLIFGWN